MFAEWLKSRQQAVWWLLFLGSSIPGLWLADTWRAGGLGPNPLETLLHTTGRSALALLTLTLAITPLRKLAATLARLTHRRSGKRIADWNWLIRLRRMLGLWCFAYALAHAWLFLDLDLGGDWMRGWVELREKPYLGAGALALALLIPLAITSTAGMMRLLGKLWRRLHMLTYAVAMLALLHFWWLVKPGDWGPLPDTLAIGILLGYRVLLATGVLERWEGHDGSETQERPVEPKARTRHPSHTQCEPLRSLPRGGDGVVS